MQPKDGHLGFLTLLIYILAVVCIFFLILTYVKIIQIRRLSLNMNTYFQQRTLRQLPNEHIISEPVSRLENGGLTSAIIDSLPAIQYREEIRKGGGHGSADCAVCLGEFSRGEWLRLLPNCAHVFHVSCIDAWFRSHSTCPLCRANVLYDLNSFTSSVSLVALLETARREDPKRERPLHYRLLELGILQNQEFMLGMMSGCLFDSNRNESVPGMVSPVVGSPSNRQTLQNQLERESSTVDQSPQGLSASPEVLHDTV